jgi:hypothetical protein
MSYVSTVVPYMATRWSSLRQRVVGMKPVCHMYIHWACVCYVRSTAARRAGPVAVARRERPHIYCTSVYTWPWNIDCRIIVEHMVLRAWPACAICIWWVVHKSHCVQFSANMKKYMIIKINWWVIYFIHKRAEHMLLPRSEVVSRHGVCCLPGRVLAQCILSTERSLSHPPTLSDQAWLWHRG